MSKTKRASMTLPESLIDDLDFCSRKLSITRSAIVAEMLAQATSNLRFILEQSIPDDGDSDSPKRRSSAEVAGLLRDQLQHLREVIDSKDEQIKVDYLGGGSNEKH